MGVGAVQTNMAVFGADQVRNQNSWIRYFDIYYAAANTGGLIAFGAIAYVQINTNYFIGYLLPGGFLVCSFLLFLVGYCFYVHRREPKCLFIDLLPVLYNSFTSWRSNSRDSSIADSLTLNWSFLDYARIDNGGQYPDSIINDIKSLRRIVVVFLLLIPYWLVYIQVETTFIVQGAHMKLPAQFEKMPVVWLSLVNQIIIICIIP